MHLERTVRDLDKIVVEQGRQLAACATPQWGH